MKKIKIISLFLLLVSQAAFGKKYTNPQQVSNGAIIVSTMPAALCDGYSSLKQTGSQATTAQQRGFVLQNHYALIKLSIPQLATNPAAATATVLATVTYEYERNSQILQGQKDITLSVEISTGKFKDIDYVKIDGALKAVVQITGVTNIGLFPQIDLVVSCEGDIYRFTPPNAVVSGLHYTAPVLRSDGSLSDGNLYVSWGNTLVDAGNNVIPNAGVEAYELEWTYVSNQGVDASVTLTKDQIFLRDYLFRNNSSRVVTTNPGYFIPLIYEKGLIVFRVRAVGKNMVNGVLTDVRSEWTTVENQTSLSNVPDAYIYSFSGLETNLNWQSSISFAEEGKNKTVVSYHDGSLRNRQAVTKINTDERAIAGETFYDYNGRPVIQTLPVPIEGTDENNLNYRPNLNVIDQKTNITKSDYDLGNQGQGCTPVVPKFSTSSGASRYYSGANGFGTTGNTGQNILNKNYIPDAKKYPYTQTLYANDNTGRIASQSGVGDAHTLGSTHETKYMYGAPLQPELSRLFGNQVGVSGHYKKNSVIDPNGQVSVSYLDLDGKVIATALAGNNNTGLDDLPGNNSRTVTSNLISNVNNVLDSDQKGKTLLFTFPVTTSVPYTFNYDMTAGVHKVTCTGINSTTPVEVSMAGVFDANLSLYNSCNTLIFSQSVSMTESFGTATAQTKNITVPAVQLPVGQYNLVKTVRLNQAKLDNYLTQYLSNSNYTCVLKDDNFLAHAFDDIDFAGCNMTCTQCRTRIDGLIQELDAKNVPLTGGEKANLYERCEALCLENSTCISSLYNMIASVSPDGQYAKVRKSPPGMDNGTSMDMNNTDSNFDVDSKDIPTNNDSGEPNISTDNSIVPEQFPLSIFNSNNVLMPNLYLRTSPNSFYRADWRRPIQVNIPGNTGENFKNQLMFTENISGATFTETDYKDENGNIAYAYIQEVSPGVYLPAVVAGATVLSENLQVEPHLYKTPLKYLADVKEFLKRWEVHYGNYLVPYHPEFGYYIECTSRSAINAYEEKLIDINAPTDDVAGDFLTVQTGSVTYYVPNVLTKDPIFTDPSIPADLKANLINKYNKYQQKFNSAGVPLLDAQNQPLYYTLPQFATVMVNCPDPTALCKRANCDIGKFEGDDVSEWVAFKSQYLTERQKVLKETSTRKAIEGRYYNGCIGNTSFPGSPEERRLLTQYQFVPGLAEWQQEQSRICGISPVIPSPYTGIATVSQIYGYQWNNYCHFLSTFNNSYILYRFNAIPLYDPNQTCNINRAYLYSKDMAAFYPPVPGTSALGNGGETCYEIVLDKDGNAQYIKTECNLGLLDQGPIMGNGAAIRSYQSCGLCPLTTQVQDLFTELLDDKVLNKPAPNFNCFTNDPNFSLGKEMESYINNSLASNIFLSWNGSFDTGTKLLTGTIIPSSSTGNNSLLFTLDFANSGIPNLSSSATATDIFKKMNIAGISLDPAGVNKFKLKAYINVNRAMPADYLATASLLTGANSTNYVPNVSNTIARYEFFIPGTISYVNDQQQTTGIDLTHCSFNPLCSTSQVPPNVLNLLNTLTYVDNTDTDDSPGSTVPLKPYDLLYSSSTPLAMIDADIYEEPIRLLLGFTQKNTAGDYVEPINPHSIKWSGAVAGTSLAGTVTYTAGGSAKTLNINIIPVDYTGHGTITNTVDFTKVSMFANVRPFDVSCTTPGICSSNKFYADAVVQETINSQPNSYVYHRVVIEIISKTNGNTDSVQPLSTQCQKIAGQ